MKQPARSTQELLGPKKLRPKTRALLERAISVEQLPPLIPRPVAADFIPCSVRTLIREEKAGRLNPIRRGQNISYERSAFLAWLGIQK